MHLLMMMLANLTMRFNPIVSTRIRNLELWVEVCLFIFRYFYYSGMSSYVYGQQKNIWVAKYNDQVFNKIFWSTFFV
jgi:hypothetical protein